MHHIFCDYSYLPLFFVVKEKNGQAVASKRTQPPLIRQLVTGQKKNELDKLKTIQNIIGLSHLFLQHMVFC